MTTRSLLFFLSLLVFRISLDYAYVEFVHVAFDAHFLSMQLNVHLAQYVVSLLIFSLSCLSLRSFQHSVGNIFQIMAAIFLVAPLTSQFGLDAEKPVAPVLATVIALIVVRVVSELRIFRRTKPYVIRHGRAIVTALSVVAVAYLVIWANVSGAASSFNLDPDLVYEFRDEASELLDVGLLGYLNLWVYKIFTIYLVCVCLDQKKYAMLVALLAVQIYFGGVTNHKVALFLPFLAIGFWYLLTKTDDLYPLPVVAAGMVLVSIATFLFFDLELISGLVIRRAFYVPSGLTFEWFDYFAKHPHVYWSDRLLSWISETEYSGTILPFVVGDELFYGHDLEANNGMVSVGYAQAGYLGVLIYAVVLGLILNAINHLSATGVPMWMAVALTIGPLRTAMADSDLSTAIGSHGLLVALVILWLYRTKPPAARHDCRSSALSIPGHEAGT